MDEQKPPPYDIAVGIPNVQADVNQTNLHEDNPPYPFNIDEACSNEVTRDSPENSQTNYHEEERVFAAGFSEKSVRKAFIRKVFSLLTAQLSVTVAFIAVFSFVDVIKEWVIDHLWFYLVAYVVFAVTYLVLVCCSSVRRRFPCNIIALIVFPIAVGKMDFRPDDSLHLLFSTFANLFPPIPISQTLSFSYLVAVVASVHEPRAVLIAAIITACACLGLTLLAHSSFDFTTCSTIIALLSICFVSLAISTVTLYFVDNDNFEYLVYDLQTILGGRKHELNPEEYIYGALQLYVDIVGLFLYILRMFGNN